MPWAEDLTRANTLALASRATAFVRIDDPAQLVQLSQRVRDYPSVLLLGGGSNVVLPGQVPGLVVQVGFRGVRLLAESDQGVLVEAQAGESWHGFVQTCVENGWDGMENLALIPGSVGASPVQNIGAYGVELSHYLHGVTAWDIPGARWVELSAKECCLAYRDSRFKHEVPGRWLIVSVRFFLPRPWRAMLEYPDLKRHPDLQDTPVTARRIFDAVCDIRARKLPDPAITGNAGSFFKNPIIDAAQFEFLRQEHPALVAYPQADGRYKVAAGWLIEQCGWKGRSLGAAAVHDRQALVLVNRGGATARDILALADAVAADVRGQFNIALEIEPVVVGAPRG